MSDEGTEETTPFDYLNDRERRDEIFKLVSELNQRERQVITQRYGLNGDSPASLQDVAESVGVSRERIRQIANIAMSKLRRAMTREERLIDEGSNKSRNVPAFSVPTSIPLAVKERAIANSKIDHGAIYKHVAANKLEIFGPITFSTCPQCDKEYRLFNNPCWKGDQSVCQACADENFAPTRKIMQQIEGKYAQQELERLEYHGPFAALLGVPA